MSWRINDDEGVFVSDIEADIPPYISNDFQKYSHPRHLARGGKADVRVYKDTNLGRHVVIKLLRPEFRNDHDELRRLLREARITAQLQHPGTVPVYELGQDDKGNYYFTMKKVAGETLFEILSNLAKKNEDYVQRFSLDRLLNIFLQIADTLSYAHVRGVIHRDVKPENILIGRFGESMLLDWGTAKVWGMPNEGPEDDLLSRGGTPLYMSPEQILGNRLIDERTDIFSMGIVLYEILTLREPFRGRDTKATFERIINDDPLPPGRCDPSRVVPKVLEDVCLKALQKNPDDRYGSMREMANEIYAFRNEALMSTQDAAEENREPATDD